MGDSFHRRGMFVAIAIGAFATASCSLFVGVDGLSGGANAIDGSADTGIADGGTNDASFASDAPPCVPAARVQFAFDVDDGGDGNSLSVALPSIDQGNGFIVIGTNYDDDCGGVQSVTDTAGNTYKNLIGSDGNDNAGDLETWGAANTVRSTSNIVTVHYGTDCSGRNVKVVEYAGIDPFNPVDPSTVSQFGGPGGVPDASITASGPAILFAHSADSRMCNGPGAGWNQIFIDNWATIAEEHIVTAGGNFIATEQASSTDQWGIQAVSLRACKSP